MDPNVLGFMIGLFVGILMIINSAITLCSDDVKVDWIGLACGIILVFVSLIGLD